MTAPWKPALHFWVCTASTGTPDNPAECEAPAVLARVDDRCEGLCAKHAHLAVDARDAEISVLRAELAAARVGVVTAEVHARAVREAWGPSDPLEWDEQVMRWWRPDPTRSTLLATLRASGLDDARAVALADGEVSDG